MRFLRHLDLSRNPLADASLSNALRYCHPTLETLSLADTGVGQNEAARLVEMLSQLKLPRLRELDLSSCCLNAAAAQPLATAFRANGLPALQELKLNGNLFGEVRLRRVPL